MAFQQKLNEYMALLSCSGRALAERSGLSPAVISRYRRGEREPSPDSQQLQRLSTAIAHMASQAELSDVTEQSVAAALQAALAAGAPDYARLGQNLDGLITALGLNLNELARWMNYDASYLSRIRSGQRRPADPEAFADGVCRFVCRRCRRAEDVAQLAALLGCPQQSLAGDEALRAGLKNWLGSGGDLRPDPVLGFLSKLDRFDLNEYIRSIRFDELKVPTAPFQLPTAKTYYGIEQMKAGELDFLKATVLSRSHQPVLMCSDMPMAALAEDLDFGKKWMLGIAMMLKKGLHLNMIHNLDRPFGELMLGLESWIPLYMTGQVSPYYLPGAHDPVYCHFTYVSGSAALSGECIAGNHENGKYYLTKNREELAYYQQRAADLLRRAKPLMDIYRQDGSADFQTFLDGDAKIQGHRHGILSAPPLHTLSDGLLAGMLTRAGVTEADEARIFAHCARQRELAAEILQNGTMLDEVFCPSREEHAQHPPVLPLSAMFYHRDVAYTREEYAEHLRLTEAYAAANPNYTLWAEERRGFHNIQIVMHQGRWALVSKSSAPVSQFVIRHPKLRAAMENMVMAVVEE